MLSENPLNKDFVYEKIKDITIKRNIGYNNKESTRNIFNDNKSQFDNTSPFHNPFFSFRLQYI